MLHPAEEGCTLPTNDHLRALAEIICGGMKNFSFYSYIHKRRRVLMRYFLGFHVRRFFVVMLSLLWVSTSLLHHLRLEQRNRILRRG